VVLKVVGIRVQDPAHPRHFSTTECGDIGGMRGSEPHAFRTWVQEVHIRDDAGGHSNCVPTRRCKMSAIFMTAKAMFERLYLIPGLVPICALCHHALGAHTPTAHALAISRILYNFFPKWPLNYHLSIIHQVIWPNARVPGLGQITWRIVLDQKNEGPGSPCNQKSRNSR